MADGPLDADEYDSDDFPEDPFTQPPPSPRKRALAAATSAPPSVEKPAGTLGSSLAAITMPTSSKDKLRPPVARKSTRVRPRSTRHLREDGSQARLDAAAGPDIEFTQPHEMLAQSHEEEEGEDGEGEDEDGEGEDEEEEGEDEDEDDEEAGDTEKGAQAEVVRTGSQPRAADSTLRPTDNTYAAAEEADSSARFVQDELAPAPAPAPIAAAPAKKKGKLVRPKPAGRGLKLPATGQVAPALENSQESRTSKNQSPAAEIPDQDEDELDDEGEELLSGRGPRSARLKHAKGGSKSSRVASDAGTRSGPSSARAEKRAREISRKSTKAPVAKSNKRLRRSDDEEEEESQPASAPQPEEEGEDEEGEEEQDEEGGQVAEELDESQEPVVAPTLEDFANEAKWRKFSATVIHVGEEEVQPRVGDCVYVVPSDLPKKPADGDRDAYWIAKIVEIKNERDPNQQRNPDGRIVSNTPVYAKVHWFWRLRDFCDGTRPVKSMRGRLEKLGFRMKPVELERHAPVQYRLQDREVIATRDTDIIHFDSVAGLADVVAFRDATISADDVYQSLRNNNNVTEIDTDRTGISNFYCRLQWNADRVGRGRALKPWTPHLPAHCTCKKHYDPAHKMVYCPTDQRWYHAACLIQNKHTRLARDDDDASRHKKLQVDFAEESDHSGDDLQRSPGKRGRPSGDADQSPAKKRPKTSKDHRGGKKSDAFVPPALHRVANSSITRGGDGGTLAGNFIVVLKAKELVDDILNDKATAQGWKDAIGWREYQEDARFVGEYTAAVQGKGKGKSSDAKGKGKKGVAGVNEELEEGYEFVCPTCDSSI